MRLPHAPFALACVLASLVCGSALAQPYPSKPIRILVPYVPGGATDHAARLVTEKAKAALGQNIVIENKAGAGGIIAIEEMARAKPDGYTLMIGNVTTNAITPVIAGKKMSINYDRDGTTAGDALGIHRELGVSGAYIQGIRRIHQEASRQSALFEHRHRELCALRHGGAAKAPRHRNDSHPLQGRRWRSHQGSGGGRCERGHHQHAIGAVAA
jgi:hypothetical protein